MGSPAVHRPTGRDEIRAAVLEAAAQRFAAEGPDASLRAIADDAGVNLGLIHRHVGNKDDLLRAVLAREIENGVGTVERAGEAGAALRRIFEGASADGRYIRIVAWLLLHEPAQLRHQDRYPAMQALRELARTTSAGENEDDAARDARLMIAMAAVYGWTVFGPQLRAAFGYGQVDLAGKAELQQRLADVVSGIVNPA